MCADRPRHQAHDRGDRLRGQDDPREAATENLYASLLNHRMNMDQASGPRMPRIKKLVLRDPVGVPSSCCTTRSVRIYPWKRILRSRAPSSGPGTFLATQFSAGCTTNISGFDLRQAQRSDDGRSSGRTGSDPQRVKTALLTQSRHWASSLMSPADFCGRPAPP